MSFVNYISNVATPLIIVLIILYGVLEKKNVFDLFLRGAKEGLNIVVSIFPTLIGLFLAIECLSDCGILDLIILLLNPVLKFFCIPSQIVPLAILRPISGSASTAIASNIMAVNGVDSRIGLIAATIMGSTETTLYTIAVYSSSVGIKNTRFVLWVSLLTDLTGVLASVFIWRILS